MRGLANSPSAFSLSEVSAQFAALRFLMIFRIFSAVYSHDLK